MRQAIVSVDELRARAVDARRRVAHLGKKWRLAIVRDAEQSNKKTRDELARAAEALDSAIADMLEANFAAATRRKV